MVLIVALLRGTLVATERSSPPTSVMSAASAATSVPVPIAMPTSAWAGAEEYWWTTAGHRCVRASASLR